MTIRDRQLPGVSLDEWSVRVQAQFKGLMAKYPLRALTRPPVEEIFVPGYRFLDDGARGGSGPVAYPASLV